MTAAPTQVLTSAPERANPYGTTTIAEILPKLNVTYFLPDIQREFVWDSLRIRRLFDSILRGFPINSFLFWKVEPKNRDKWRAYKFIQDYKERYTHNERANTEGVRGLTLVLDGQQRLSSLMIGLKGTYAIRPVSYSHYSIESNWRKQKLYVDLLHDASKVDDETGEKITYGLEFFAEHAVPATTTTRHWFKVGSVLDLEEEADFNAALDSELAKIPTGSSASCERLIRKNLERLYTCIWKDPVISYYSEKLQEYDRALTIFIRTNHAGKPLSKPDLMLSIITARWRDIDARDDIHSFVDSLNGALGGRPRFSIDNVMKTALFLTDLPIQYKVDNFTNAHVDHIYSHWREIKESLVSVVRLIRSFGLTGASLVGVNPLIPIAYFINRYPRTNLLSEGREETRIANRIRLWLLSSLLIGTFSGQSDTALNTARLVLQEKLSTRNDFPVEDLNKRVAALSGDVALTSLLVDKVLYGSPSYLTLSLLYDEKNWDFTAYHIDHIFPKSKFNSTELAAASIPSEKHERYRQLLNSIANLELLNDRDNEKKTNTPFEKWITTRTDNFTRKHLIPEDKTLYAMRRFEEFIEKREGLIRDHLREIFSTTK